MQDGPDPPGVEPPSLTPESIPNFKRGRYLGLIAFVLALVAGVAAVLALSGVFEGKKQRRIEFNSENREGGCPCNCDRSKAMAAELRALGGDGALRAIDKSLATIAEREESGYITEAMITHRLRLLNVEREMRQAGTIPAALHTRALPFSDLEHRAVRPELRVIDGGSLRVGMELIVHGQTTEWVVNRQKLQLACFLLSMEIRNSSDAERIVKQPRVVANVPFPISRWYSRGENGQPWDGKLKGQERKLIHVIGYVGKPISPKTRVDATIQFESATFHATTWARARWDRVEPTRLSL